MSRVNLVATAWRRLAPARQAVKLWIFRWRGIIPAPFVLTMGVLAGPESGWLTMQDVVMDLLGTVVIAAGLVLRIWAVGCTGSHTRSYRLRAPRLVTSGPYAYVRNPIYAANFLVGLGLVVMAESWIGLVLLLGGFAAEYGAIVSLEEEFLAATFGAEYDQYRRRVPRWLPRAVSAATAGEFSWRAVRKEYLAWASAGAMGIVVELGEYISRLALR